MGLQFHLLNSFYPSHNRIHFKSQKWSKLEIASRAFPLSRESQIRLLISPKSLDLDLELSSVYQLPSVQPVPILTFLATFPTQSSRATERSRASTSSRITLEPRSRLLRRFWVRGINVVG